MSGQDRNPEHIKVTKNWLKGLMRKQNVSVRKGSDVQIERECTGSGEANTNLEIDMEEEGIMLSDANDTFKVPVVKRTVKISEKGLKSKAPRKSQEVVKEKDDVSQMLVQRPIMTRSRGAIEGGRRRGGDLRGATLRTADGDASGDGDLGGADMPERAHKTLLALKMSIRGT